MPFARTAPGLVRDGLPKFDLTQYYPTYGRLRTALGQTRRFAERLDLNHVLPRNEFASSGYCLAKPGEELLVYIPDDDRVDVYLGIEPRAYSMEWFDTLKGETATREPVTGIRLRGFVSPFGIESVLYLRRINS